MIYNGNKYIVTSSKDDGVRSSKMIKMMKTKTVKAKEQYTYMPVNNKLK